MWAPEFQAALIYRRDALTEDCLRVYPDLNRPFIFHTDASDYVLGGILVQLEASSGAERVVEYFSRSASVAECNYSVFEEESLAVVAPINRWWAYLCNPFIIYTDHNVLCHARSQRAYAHVRHRGIKGCRIGECGHSSIGRLVRDQRE